MLLRVVKVDVSPKRFIGAQRYRTRQDGGTGEEGGTGDDDKVEVELESEGEAVSGTRFARLVISNWKAKKRKKKRNLRRMKVARLDKTKETQKKETWSINSRNGCTEKYRNHKQSQAVISML